MLKFSILLFVFLSTWLSATIIPSLELGKINGEPIFEEDLRHDTQAKTRDEKIKRLIQYRLIVQEAKKRGLDRTPEIQADINALLYKRFIEDERKTKKREFSPTEVELNNFYAKFPLVRIRHLVLNRRTEMEKQVADLALDQIQKGLKKESSFESLCTQFSQDSAGLFGGDTDFRGPHNFPEEIYLKVLALAKNSVSDPIELGNTVHLFQWFEKKPFTAAPASYLQFLQGRFEQERELALLNELLKDLEQKATVEPPSLWVKLK